MRSLYNVESWSNSNDDEYDLSFSSSYSWLVNWELGRIYVYSSDYTNSSSTWVYLLGVVPVSAV